MTIEVGHMNEPLLTYVASKRLLSRVDSHVRLQAGVVCETFVANVARERPFARVNTKMGLEVGQPAARLCA